MARPIGTTRVKDNSHRLYQKREEWMKAKKLGRRKQVWVWDGPVEEGFTTGRWEKA